MSSEIRRRDTRSTKGDAVSSQRRANTLLTVAIELIVLLILPFAALLRLQWSAAHVFGTFGFTSLLTFGVYYLDKRRAMNAPSAYRISELTLHVFELCGGWPGALVAQQFLRHKTGKLTFRIVFWLIVCVYQAISFEIVNGWVAIPRVFALLSSPV